MKYNFVLIFLISFISFAQKSDQNLKFYGSKINLKEIENYKLKKNKLLNNPNNDVKIQGKIISTCPMKGCWMKMNVNNDTLLVRFKDYGFFVPKTGSEGKSVIINGKLSIDTLSVGQLKHYAEDAGKTKYEISLITKPEITLSFLADGVIIKN
tara:strand:- start:8890 stop:9348 length:459 start_codon:yes stop_codon:yes gene_type:complete